ncbi:MAG: hypothetical protein LUC30_00640 [Clostridiales bacterium]|nr:hypothetical protein [Clostridiales bacterium]
MKMDFECYDPPRLTRAELDARLARRERNCCILLTSLLAAALAALTWGLFGLLPPSLLDQFPWLDNVLAIGLLSSLLAAAAELAVYLVLRRSLSWQSLPESL